MTIFEQISWIHKEAITLQTDDLVSLKWALKQLIYDATEALEQCRGELQAQRRKQGKIQDHQ